MLRLRLIHLALRAMGVHPQYAVRFLPAQPKRIELRGRTHAVFDNPADVLAYWSQLKAGAHLKEKTRGTYYLAIESKVATFHERRVPVSRTAKDIAENGPEPGGLFGGLPAATQGGTDPADQEETQPADQAGADGAGADDQRDAGAEASSAPRQPVGVTKISLRNLGVR